MFTPDAALLPMPTRSRSVVVPSGGGKTFEAEAAALLTRLRSTLTEMLSGIPGGVRKSRDVHKYLGVDANLSWQVMKLLTAEDAFAAARYVPGEFPLKRIFESARGIGVAGARVAAAESAAIALSSFVIEHAGDWDSFQSMLAARDGAEGDEEDAIGLAHRKAMFKGHSHYWGHQVDTQVVAMMIQPSAGKPGKFDYLHVRTMKGLRRLRSSASMGVDSYKLNAPSPEDENQIQHFPIDPESHAIYGASVLPAFCSIPVPELKTSVRADNRSFVELAADTVGRRGQVDLTFGTVGRGGPLSPTPDGGQGFGSLVRIGKPTAILVADMLVHRPSLPQVEARLLVNGVPPLAQDEFDFNDPRTRLPFNEKIRLLGRGGDATTCLDFPLQRELYEYICSRMSWNLDDFDVYRARVEFPLMDTMVSMVFQVR